MLFKHLDYGEPHRLESEGPLQGAQLRTTTETGAKRAAGPPPDTGEARAARAAEMRGGLPIDVSRVDTEVCATPTGGSAHGMDPKK